MVLDYSRGSGLCVVEANRTLLILPEERLSPALGLRVRYSLANVISEEEDRPYLVDAGDWSPKVRAYRQSVD
ncbi:MAG: hypothetical protein ACLU4J_16580 [Butyricimonas paravirosa]